MRGLSPANLLVHSAVELHSFCIVSIDSTASSHSGVAAALTLLDMPASVKLPPLECLFTVDEETGLTGVRNV